ncbi:MAG: MFS transporter [Hyphomicrobiales bacterium]|nr:MAG: MFS transporter [Hyphomicrobiales bacterium]
MSYPLFSIVMERNGVSNTLIGMNGGAHALGLAVATLTISRLTLLIRGDYLFAVALFGCACSLAIFATSDALWVWFWARFCLGYCVNIVQILSGAWLNTACTGDMRGRVAGLFGMGVSIGLAVGSLAIPLFGKHSDLAFGSLALYVTSISLLPLVLMNRISCRPGQSARGAKFDLFKKAPLIAVMVFVYAFTNVTAISTMPVYFVRLDYDETFAAFSITILTLSMAISQPIVGWLLDHTSYKLVAISAGLIAGLAFLVIPWLAAPPMILMAFGLVGAGCLALYTCALTMLGDQFSGGALVSGSAAIALSYAVGSAGGSSITGAVMDIFGPFAAPVAAGIVLICFTVALGREFIAFFARIFAVACQTMTRRILGFLF